MCESPKDDTNKNFPERASEGNTAANIVHIEQKKEESMEKNATFELRGEVNEPEIPTKKTIFLHLSAF